MKGVLKQSAVMFTRIFIVKLLSSAIAKYRPKVTFPPGGHSHCSNCSKFKKNGRLKLGAYLCHSFAITAKNYTDPRIYTASLSQYLCPKVLTLININTKVKKVVQFSREFFLSLVKV